MTQEDKLYARLWTELKASFNTIEELEKLKNNAPDPLFETMKAIVEKSCEMLNVTEEIDEKKEYIIRNIGYQVMDDNELDPVGAIDFKFSTEEDRRTAWKLLKRVLPDYELDEEIRFNSWHSPWGSYSEGTVWDEYRIYYEEGEKTIEEMEVEEEERDRIARENKIKENKKKDKEYLPF